MVLCETSARSERVARADVVYSRACRAAIGIGITLEQLTTVNGAAVSAFVDSGVSFNAITPALGEKLRLQVIDHRNPLKLKLGAVRVSFIPRRTCALTIQLPGFPNNESTAFVMEVPESKELLLGIPWLVETNPLINWAKREITPRTASIPNTDAHPVQFCPCVPRRPAWQTAGCRTRQTAPISQCTNGDEALTHCHSGMALRHAQGKSNSSLVIPVLRTNFLRAEKQRRLAYNPRFQWAECQGASSSKPDPAEGRRGKWFSAMDLLWGFYQVKLSERSIPYTAFASPDGLYEYLVTPMGISSTFNRLVRSIFTDYTVFCQTYFDDLFVFTESDSIEDHLTALEKVLERCEQQHLFIKCVFCRTEIPCLSDYIGRDDIRMDPRKSASIRDWPLPRTKRNAVVYRFCADFASYVALLTESIKNKRPHEPITLNTRQLEAFSALKTKLASPPVLGHPDVHDHFTQMLTPPTLLSVGTSVVGHGTLRRQFFYFP
ncbi:unnamed protein product [Phytophthora lilii]|uniref:Unnamed protein product n=1 Tax=Phytophthora lilii TaxID=2077276 RepID=A0A9W6XT11_9STRA|nr:unnamed protein product [Phytophthora lilii]